MSLDINKKITILIPALNPTEEFIEYINELIENGFEDIIVVNDGSKETSKTIFENISKIKKCTIIVHKENQGKGKALKDGLKYFKIQSKGKIGIITADCDGQHLVKDIVKIAEKIAENSNSLILGTRNFNQKDVPEKSSFGNKITSSVFKILYGIEITDTQTGLRGIPLKLVEEFQKIQGNRYEYETNMLIFCIKEQIEMIEEPITTVYIDKNVNSNFRPVKDSIMIYGRILNSFLKYSMVSILSFILDIMIFKVFLMTVKLNIEQAKLIVLATVFARIISSLFNYILNKKVTFKSNEKIISTLVKYYILCVTQMIISGLLVATIYSLTGWTEVGIKLIIDTILFVVNYRIQKIWVFNTKLYIKKG